MSTLFSPLIRRCGVLLCAALLGACAAPKSYDYTALKQSNPRSIVVLPPVNNSPDVRASYSMLTTVTAPLAESGYYVFPIALVDQTFKENGLEHPGDMHAAPLPKLSEIFGADAALYITIDQYGAVYQILDSSVIVKARAKLVDTRSGQLLWEGQAAASSSENDGNNNAGVVGLLVKALVKQILNNMGDQGHGVARVTSYRLLSAHPGGLLPGPRSPNYGKY